MTATRSKSAANGRPLRQSRLDFSNVASTSSSPAPNSALSVRSRASDCVGPKSKSSSNSSNAVRLANAGAIVHKLANTRSSARSDTRRSVQFLGASTRKKQTYLQHSSSDEDQDSDAVIVPVKSSAGSGDKVDSENLLGHKYGTFVYDETDEDEEDEDDDVPIVSSVSRKRKRAAEFVVDDEEEGESRSEQDESDDNVVEVSTPRKKSRTTLQQQDAHDLADDLEFLHSSPPAVTPKGARSSKKDERSRALEELKRKREQRKPKSVANGSSSQSKRQRMVVLDSSEEESAASQAESSNSQVSETDSEVEEADAYEVFEEHEEDQEFIEDDELGDKDGEGAGGGRLGVPTSSIPIAFTSWATAKPRELFKFGVEWFVQKKINPAFSRDDEIYQLTWQKLNDEITGLVGSKFTSSAWNRDFTFSLQSRPKMSSTRVEAAMQDCEACNRTGHPATWQVQFTGLPYDTSTYEDVEQDSDEEAEDIQRDQRGHKIPPASRVYSMGATCFKNATIAHRLKHWRYSLGQWVLDYLQDVGELDANKIVARDTWKEARRRSHAEEIAQRMEDEGEIASLYRTMKGEVNNARGTLDQY